MNLRQPPRVAETELDLDEPVAADARTHGQRHVRMDELEMRDLEPFAAAGRSPLRGECGRPQLDAERRAGFGGRNNEDGSLNTEHRDLLKEHDRGQTVRTESGWGLVPSRSKRAGSGVHVTFEGYSRVATLCHASCSEECTASASEADVARR